jgi:hypothetical protein
MSLCAVATTGMASVMATVNATSDFFMCSVPFGEGG